MPRQPKPFEHPLAPELAREILNIPIEPSAEAPPRTIGERLERAREAIDEANLHLATSPVAKIVAQSLMQKLKRRGDATIVVRPDGMVVLRVAPRNGSDAPATARPRRDAPMVQTVHSSALPYLDELRAQAEELGIDIGHLGRSRKSIHAFILAHKANMRGNVDEVRTLPLDDLPRLRPRADEHGSNGKSEVDIDTLLGLEGAEEP